MMNRNNRGKASEALVATALTILKNRLEKKYKRGQHSNSVPLITNVVHAEPNSPLDRQKKDFVINFHGGQEVFLQVKSSERGRRKFNKICNRLGLSINVVVVDPNNDVVERVVHRLFMIIKQVFDTARRAIASIRARTQRPVPKKRRQWCPRPRVWAY